MAEGTTFADDIVTLGDKIAALTIAKAVELKDYLKEKYKIEPAAGGVVMQGGGGPAPVAEKPAEKTEFTVVLEDFDAAKKINVIKVVRELTGLGLKEAKAVADEAPAPVKEGVTRDEADQMKAKLEEAGGTVEVR